ncbi:MAG: hypothetical protein NTV22_01155 [bacterium]|nr:hypothetical protein [bacterium]
MHILIHILLSADTKAMAITHTQFTLDNLIEAGHYDYYNIGIESRWPDIPIAVGAHTKQGTALLDIALQATKDEFDNNGNAIHNPRELQELLCANNMWVVSADVHI